MVHSLHSVNDFNPLRVAHLLAERPWFPYLQNGSGDADKLISLLLRVRYWAQQDCRLLTKSLAGQEVGADPELGG